MAKTNLRDTAPAILTPGAPSGPEFALFETQRDTLNFTSKLNIVIQSLKADWLAWAALKWGPMGFGASISDPTKLAEFQADRDRFRPFSRWVDTWDDFYAKLLTYSWWNPWPDYYREAEAYAKEYNAWRTQYTAATAQKPSAPGIVIPSALPGVIPGTSPGGQDEGKPAWLTAVQWGVVGLGIYFGGKFLLAYMRERKAAAPAPRALPAATGSASGLEPWPSYDSGCLPCERKG